VDDLERLLNSIVGWAMVFTAQDMVMSLVEKMIEAEKEVLTKTLGREPTHEERQFYRDLQWQKSNRENARQREIDREKIRRLVFGEDSGGNSKAD
jgi:hypothetical protein